MNAKRRTELLAVLGMVLSGSNLVVFATPVFGGPSEGPVSPPVRLVVGSVILLCALVFAIHTIKKLD